MPQLFISSTLPLHSLSRKARAAKVGTPRPIHATTMRAGAIFFVIQCAVAPPPPGDSGGSSGSSSSCATDGSSATYAETSATPASRASFSPTLFVRSRPRRQRHQHAHHRDEHVSESREHVHGKGRQRLRLPHRHERRRDRGDAQEHGDALGAGLLRRRRLRRAARQGQRVVAGLVVIVLALAGHREVECAAPARLPADACALRRRVGRCRSARPPEPRLPRDTGSALRVLAAGEGCPTSSTGA